MIAVDHWGAGTSNPPRSWKSDGGGGQSGQPVPKAAEAAEAADVVILDPAAA
jgi:hypothetical protein